MKTNMPPTAAIQGWAASGPWEMSAAAADPRQLLLGAGAQHAASPSSLGQHSLSSPGQHSLSSPGQHSLSSSPPSQPDSGLQSSECLSEDELEGPGTSTNQTPEEHRPSRAVKSERPGQKSQPAPYHKPSRPGSPKVQGARPGPLGLLEKTTTAASDAELWRARLVAAIQAELGVEKFLDFQCVSEAERLVQVTGLMAKGHQLHHFLRVFGHSVSCHNAACVKPCLMFRRIRGHLAGLDHECAIVHVYSQLTRMHVDTCVTEKCGFPTCKGLQAYRARENNEVLPRNFYLLERDNSQALAKKAPVKNGELPMKKETDDSNKENQRSYDNLAATKEIAAELTPQALVKKEAVDETNEALDLSHRVSKLEVGSSMPQGTARA